jgi:hypothetical protein
MIEQMCFSPLERLCLGVSMVQRGPAIAFVLIRILLRKDTQVVLFKHPDKTVEKNGIF